MTTIRQAGVDDAPAIAPLFDAYRQFYGKPSDPDLAHSFIEERLANAESVIFLAVDDAGRAIGFVQLYPSFSSVSAGRVYVLNDLFIAPEARRGSVATELMAAAAGFARGRGALRLSLSTGMSNLAAQSLYERQGWVRDQQYFHYSLAL
ncbi:GNAT family N-acetyltransferase [Massilia yuzhufengensis]|uniref:Ribosomal protein S18 acetylase RimI n=1 Tax=Massilia yuzhufengensis TaxID=1164594 RepID=A0A1I1LEX3_9BURK|nr:GNAT family N-acetyltransferase [Massilia yuzhufengensis]SFC71707.1 Ribosomal protein S18 acetylase RimI [Massilia yuzhufengensis]